MAKTDRTASEGPLQFGQREPGRDYPDRPASFGIAERDGKIALVRVTREGGEPYCDLPGGAIDEGEDAREAVVREFGEETGLAVRAGELVACFDQYFIRDNGKPANNRCRAYVMEIAGEDPALKIEEDHALVWATPDEAIRTLRHDGHAWAVAAWLRMGHG